MVDFWPHFLPIIYVNFIYYLLVIDSGSKNETIAWICEKDVKVLRKMKMVGFCSEQVIMFDFYRWNGVPKNRISLLD